MERQIDYLKGTLTLASVKGNASADELYARCSKADAEFAEQRQELFLAWFRGPRKALQFAAGVAGASPDQIAVGISTADIDADGGMGRLVEEAGGAVKLAEAGQVILALSAQELVRNSIGAEESFIDLGTRTVNPGAAPCRLFQYVAPGLRSDPALPKSSAPWSATRFVGRGRDIEELGRLFDVSRLISIVGPMGIGKSALASRVEQTSQNVFSGGTFWVDLTMVTRANLLLHRVAQALEIHVLNEPTLLDQIAKRFGEADVLLVLDSVDRIRESVADFIERLQHRCRNLTIITTGLRRLALPSETVYELGGLDYPVLGEPLQIVKEYDSVQVFTEAALTVDPHFQLYASDVDAVVAIAALLEGSPKALQMAAAHVSVMTVQSILGRLSSDPLPFLKDRSGGSEGMRSAMSASIGLLTPWANRLFKALSVFQGPFDMEMLQQICVEPETLPSDALLPALRELVELHLVQPLRTARRRRAFYLSPLLKELASSLEGPSLRSRHNAYIADQITGIAERGMKGSVDDLEQFDLLYESCREQWLRKAKTNKVTSEMNATVVACGRYWFQRGYYGEGVELANAILSSTSAARTSNYSRVLNLAAWCNMRSGAYAEAKMLFLEMLRRAYQEDNIDDVAYALNGAASLAYECNRPRTAASCMRRLVELLPKCSEKVQSRPMYASNAVILIELGRLEEAESMLDTYAKSLGGMSEWSDMSYLGNVAHLMLQKGQPRKCWDALRQTCDHLRSTPDPDYLLSLYGTAFGACLELGLEEESKVLFSCSESIIDHYGLFLTPRRRKDRARRRWLASNWNDIPRDVWSEFEPLYALDCIGSKVV